MVRFVILMYDIYFNRSDLSLFVYRISKFFVDVIFGYVVNVSKLVKYEIFLKLRKVEFL